MTSNVTGNSQPNSILRQLLTNSKPLYAQSTDNWIDNWINNLEKHQAQQQVHSEIFNALLNSAHRPTDGTITSPYGKQREYGWHKGVDFADSTGKPVNVYAIMDGTVRNIGVADPDSFGQNVTVVDWSDGTTSIYGHTSTMNVFAGSKLKKGQIIGKTGNLGRAKTAKLAKPMGIHLHFQHYDKNGNLIDPVELYGW
jgi:murein DD-endopeptidase MepM/ murein hydrolase activator NlpD